VFQTKLLFPLDPPHTYIQNTCQYLQDKWNSKNSPPGTVVMVIMFHSIVDSGITNSNQTSTADFHALMQALHDHGFQAINMTQMDNFMENNAKIPPRSALLIADDRHARAYFDALFRPYYDQWGWPVVNAWISTPLNSADLWQQQVDLEKEGWVDHQAHGVVHFAIGNYSSGAYIAGELQGSINAFKKYFNKIPIAIIWPGGGYSHQAVQMARQLGYRLGFTTFPRGPSMFNWVPLADVKDPERPALTPPGLYPDGTMNDPLMVLPRYWDTDAIQHITTVVQISQDAAAYAQANKATELEYYDSVCAPMDGEIP
jgi:hypothetical protein